MARSLFTLCTSTAKVGVSRHAQTLTDRATVCEINYHHNFKVSKGERVYYGGVPDVVQIGEHQFVERQVIEIWLSLLDHWYVFTLSDCPANY